MNNAAAATGQKKSEQEMIMNPISGLKPTLFMPITNQNFKKSLPYVK